MGTKLQFRDLKRQYEHIKDSVDSNIQDVISSTSFISGSQVKELESLLANFVGVKHCITCGNGTDAITIALRVLTSSIPVEDRKNHAVFVPDFTFFSTGECPADLGFSVYFVDVKKETYNLDPADLEKKIEQAIANGHTPSIVIPVDLFGQPAEYESIRSIADKHSLHIIEDSAQGFGGRIDDKVACSFADISTTSFFPAKPLGCYGDGGAIFTNDDNYADLARSIAVHGKDTSNPSDPMSKYNNIRLGYNSRLDTLQAAILLAKFPEFRDRELDNINRVAEKYTLLLSDCESLKVPTILPNYYSSWAQYTVVLEESIDRDAVQEKLKAAGIPTMVYYKKPMHMQGAFRNTVGEQCECPVTEELCRTVLCLPIHPYLEENEVEFIVDELKRAVK